MLLFGFSSLQLMFVQVVVASGSLYIPMPVDGVIVPSVGPACWGESKPEVAVAKTS